MLWLKLLLLLLFFSVSIVKAPANPVPRTPVLRVRAWMGHFKPAIRLDDRASCAGGRRGRGAGEGMRQFPFGSQAIRLK